MIALDEIDESQFAATKQNKLRFLHIPSICYPHTKYKKTIIKHKIQYMKYKRYITNSGMHLNISLICSFTEQ